MDWKPIELTEKEKEWMEGQQAAQNAILNAFNLTTPRVTMPLEGGLMVVDAKPPEHTQEQKNIIRGMGVCAEVGKLYKQRGNPPKWMKLVDGKWVQDEAWENKPRNRAYRRAIRFTMIAERPADQYACGTCGLPFIGPTTQRCQCKPVVLKKQQDLERAKELAKKMREAAREAA